MTGQQESIAKAAAALKKAQRVVAFTGAGVSAESGVPTFRGAGGLWEGYPVEQVATPEAFAADPLMVWRFYEQRRINLASKRPNPAHQVLARWQHRFPSFLLTTQNVDSLHEDAGSSGVIHLHGTIWRVRCLACGEEREDRTAPFPSLPPRCPCGGMLRPAVVWFGETLPADALETSIAACERCEVLVVVGTSALVYPAAGLVEVAFWAGAKIIEVNPQPSALSSLAQVALRGPAGELLPQLEAALGH